MSGIIYHLSTQTKITVTKTFIFLPTFSELLSLQCKMCRASSHTIGDLEKFSTFGMKGTVDGKIIGGTNRGCVRPSRRQKPGTEKVHFLGTSRKKVQKSTVDGKNLGGANRCRARLTLLLPPETISSNTTQNIINSLSLVSNTSFHTE
jgi:hypothetical protein